MEGKIDTIRINITTAVVFTFVPYFSESFLPSVFCLSVLHNVALNGQATIISWVYKHPGDGGGCLLIHLHTNEHTNIAIR